MAVEESTPTPPALEVQPKVAWMPTHTSFCGFAFQSKIFSSNFVGKRFLLETFVLWKSPRFGTDGQKHPSSCVSVSAISPQTCDMPRSTCVGKDTVRGGGVCRRVGVNAKRKRLLPRPTLRSDPGLRCLQPLGLQFFGPKGFVMLPTKAELQSLVQPDAPTGAISMQAALRSKNRRFASLGCLRATQAGAGGVSGRHLRYGAAPPQPLLTP